MIEDRLGREVEINDLVAVGFIYGFGEFNVALHIGIVTEIIKEKFELKVSYFNIENIDPFVKLKTKKIEIDAYNYNTPLYKDTNGIFLFRADNLLILKKDFKYNTI